MSNLPTVAEVAQMIDHSLLRPELALDDVLAGCDLAAEYAVASVCVKPADVEAAVERLAGTGVLVGTVVGFPHGSATARVKAAEARAALSEGARELDMVLNIGRLRGGQDDVVLDDIRAVVEAAPGAVVKVIFENAYLTDAEKIRACRLSEQAGAGYVKTSTGFAPSGATLADVRLMRANVTDRVRVKAAGGVRTLDVLLEMTAAGASRFGATTTAAMLDELAARRAGRGIRGSCA
ncbi:deoxyribose-phosphate aldolase [Nonomuraea sp. K274]|uniref:Deoxyribose-phosphate aldolase n=1 Tax=Nonomuraea cypriaca TaxID=1187855 RepID=A0A931AKJ9_9ACTN|nr:deoxyribose-phosphate aldolase [Nonomuraea cypriaca]MBF8193440.1 deoxyribose-phosphate aldolase [Nonomuraea cypriaca]